MPIKRSEKDTLGCCLGTSYIYLRPVRFFSLERNRSLRTGNNDIEFRYYDQNEHALIHILLNKLFVKRTPLSFEIFRLYFSLSNLVYLDFFPRSFDARYRNETFIYDTSLFLLSQLILDGDIESNPGPNDNVSKSAVRPKGSKKKKMFSWNSSKDRSCHD